MAAHIFLRQNLTPVAAGLGAATLSFYPRTIYAESPEQASIPVRPTPPPSMQPPAHQTPQKARKPIYDDPTRNNPPGEPIPPPSSLDSHAAGTSHLPPPNPSDPTPTDRVQTQVRRARLGIYDISSQAETSFNNFLARAFNVEHNFTTTIRSLAPPSDINEPLLPGFVYILVATLSGSIITRNRGFLLRFSVPLALGIGTARATIPYTMRNVDGLVWKYEERYPAVADAHVRVRERARRVWETGKAHTQGSLAVLEEKVDEAREGVEGWVGKGK